MQGPRLPLSNETRSFLPLSLFLLVLFCSPPHISYVHFSNTDELDGIELTEVLINVQVSSPFLNPNQGQAPPPSSPPSLFPLTSVHPTLVIPSPMHFLSSLLCATGFATLLLFSPISASSSSSPSRLFTRSTSKICSPQTSEYLYNVHADGVTKFGFMGHYSYIRLVSSSDRRFIYPFRKGGLMRWTFR